MSSAGNVHPLLRSKRMQPVSRAGNMQLEPSAGKHVTNIKRWKTCHRCQVREKHVTGVKRGKTCYRCQAREIMQPVPSAGNHATGAKRGKSCNRCQAQENMELVSEYIRCQAPETDMQPVSSAGKHASNARRRKTYNRCQARGK